MRINKYIATCGICSRRKAEEYVLQGKVRVNGRVINNLSTEIDENKDKVTIDEKIITLEKENVYIMLNKPKGYVTTNLEQFGRKSTLDLINENIRVFPIGRLDMYTEGLLLFTNDGEFANKLMHPKSCIKKVYEVRVDRKIEDSMIETLENGVDIGGYVTNKANVEKINDFSMRITISEGKNRQVRKMCEAVSLKVKNLKRIQIGNLTLGNLKLGKYRFLTEKDIKKISN